MSIQDLSQSILSSVSEAWGTLFMKQVDLAPQAPILLEESTDVALGSYVCCELEFSGDIKGKNRFYLAKVEALTMVGMMMAMGSDDELVNSTRAGELGAEELDALKEAFNQFAATAATVLRDKKDCKVSATVKKLESVECEGIMDGFGDGDQIIPMTLSLEGYDDGQFYQIVSDEYVQTLSHTSSDSKAPASGEASKKAPKESAAVSIEKIRGLTVNADLILAERNMDVKQLLTLCVGSVIEFWKPCDSPAELCVQDIPVANGEVVLCQNQHFGVRVQVISPPKHIYQKGAR
jgi:flagellar motor switch/type III secretory pathway protein FliN